MEVIVRRQDQERCASITCMIRHYVARRAQVIEDHPHNAEIRTLRNPPLGCLSGHFGYVKPSAVESVGDYRVF